MAWQKHTIVGLKTEYKLRIGAVKKETLRKKFLLRNIQNFLVNTF